jgi:hypothetical protein
LLICLLELAAGGEGQLCGEGRRRCWYAYSGFVVESVSVSGFIENGSVERLGKRVQALE